MSFNTVINQIEKKYGKYTIGKVSNVGAQKIRRVSSGFFRLDCILGGGWPAGRINLVYGDESTGKTTILLKTIAEAQKICPICHSFKEKIDSKCPVCKKISAMQTIYIDAEGSLDPKWSMAIGIDCDYMHTVRARSSEQAIDIADSFLRDPEGANIVIIDSLAALSPMKEIESSIEDSMVGIHARLINGALRKWNSALNDKNLSDENRPTIFLINQIRHKIGVLYGSPETIPAGKMQLFSSSVILRLSPIKYHDGKNDSTTWATMKAVTKKNKTYVPKLECDFDLCIKGDNEVGVRVGDTGDDKAILKMALTAEIIEKDKEYSWRNMKSGTQDGLLNIIIEKGLIAELRRETLGKICE